MNRREFLRTSSGIFAGTIGATLLAEEGTRAQPPARKKQGGTKDAATNAQTEAPGKTWMVVVGVNTYTYGIRALPSPTLDVVKIVNSFEGTSTQVIPLVNGVQESKFPRPTKFNIEQAFQQVAAKVGPNDSFWFYFSGHGTSIDKISYLLPEDTRLGPNEATTMISVSDLRKRMQAIPARNRVLVLDSCHSGSAKGPGDKAASWEGILGNLPGVVTMAACEVDQSAIDTGKGSLFTNYLLEGVLGRATEGNGPITIGSLERFVKTKVTAESLGKQTPVFLYAKQADVPIARAIPSALQRLPSLQGQIQIVRRPLKPGLIVLIEEEHTDSAGNRERDTSFQLALQGSFINDGFPVLIGEEARNFRVRLADPDAEVAKEAVGKLNSRFLLRGTVKVRPVPKRFDVQNDFESVQAQINAELIDTEGGTLGTVTALETGRGISDASATKMALDRATKKVHDAMYDKLDRVLTRK